MKIEFFIVFIVFAFLIIARLAEFSLVVDFSTEFGKSAGSEDLRPNLKNLSRGLNLRHGLNMVGSA